MPKGIYKRTPGMTADQRFWDKVRRLESGCWEFMGSRNIANYGMIRENNKAELAHRKSWRLVNGSIPEGVFVCHRCDNPPCVNPDHLFLGSNNDNIKDSMEKGRRARKVSPADVAEIKSRWTWGNGILLAKEYGVCRSTISKIIRRAAYNSKGQREQMK